jgi:FkbM family methyltransferase
MMKQLAFRITWTAAWPMRFYYCRSPFQSGRGASLRVLDAILDLAPQDAFCAKLNNGQCAELRFDEVIGRTFMIWGSFERGESRFLAELSARGTTAIDVGANVGVLTVAMADAVGSDGEVWAFEPVPETAQRLRRNIAINDLENVRVFELAAAESEGGAFLNLADDPAYHSLGSPYEGRGTGRQIRIPTTTLDRIWRESGEPTVSVIKIDTEGTECAVVSGARALMSACRPVIMAEAQSPAAVSALADVVSKFGYREIHDSELNLQTHVFRVAE